MSVSTPTSRVRRCVSTGSRTLEISHHIREENRWEMNGDGTALPVALQCATPVPFTEAQDPSDQAYKADEVWYYSPTNCVFIIRGDTVVTITPANPSSLDLSSLVQCDTCGEWTGLQDGSGGFRCAYCDSDLTEFQMPIGVSP